MNKAKKKGVALEYAVIMLTVVFGFCLTILTLSLSAESKNVIQDKALSRYTAVNQIGEEFLSGSTNFDSVGEKENYKVVFYSADPLPETYDGYVATVKKSSTVKSVTITQGASDNVLLYVEITTQTADDWSDYSLSKWQCNVKSR